MAGQNITDDDADAFLASYLGRSWPRLGEQTKAGEREALRAALEAMEKAREARK